MNPETNTNNNSLSPEGQPASPQVTPNSSTTSVIDPTPTYPPRMSKAKVILIVVGAIVAIVIAVFIYMYMLGMQVLNASGDFMKNITTGKVDEARAQTDGASQESMTAAAAATKGSFVRVNQATATVGDRKIVYILYDLEGATAEQARTSLEKKDGKWKITGFVYGKDLKVIPDSKNNSQTNASTEPAGNACLVASDFDTLYKDATGVARPAERDYTKIDYSGNFHFDPDSFEFSAPASLNTDKVTYFANFIKQNSAKSFTVHLKGSVATTTQSDLSFARQRAEKVKTLLVAQGADANHIVIDEPGNVDDMGQGASTNDVNKRSARSVVLTIDAACTSSSSSSGR